MKSCIIVRPPRISREKDLRMKLHEGHMPVPEPDGRSRRAARASSNPHRTREARRPGRPGAWRSRARRERERSCSSRDHARRNPATAAKACSSAGTRSGSPRAYQALLPRARGRRSGDGAARLSPATGRRRNLPESLRHSSPVKIGAHAGYAPLLEGPVRAPRGGEPRFSVIPARRRISRAPLTSESG